MKLSPFKQACYFISLILLNLKGSQDNTMGHLLVCLLEDIVMKLACSVLFSTFVKLCNK